MTTETKDRLINEIRDLLNEYNHDSSYTGVKTIVDTWFENKKDLISLFEKHPNYNGNFQIVFSHDYTRELDFNKVEQMFPLLDHLSCVVDGSYGALKHLARYMKSPQLQKEDATFLNGIYPALKASTGQKVSRVINKIFTLTGCNKHPDYNAVFARVADAINPLQINRYTVLSIHPMDYLTMSFGNSWSSCHTIDKANERMMSNGADGIHCSGTLSYMLDDSSFVFYTIAPEYTGTTYYLEPKIQRQMFHYANEALLQGRLYPSHNDGADHLYEQIRVIVQEQMAQMLGLPNLWDLKKGTENCCDHTESYGTHYRDYVHSESCTLSIHKDKDDISAYETLIEIGHDPICPDCGYEHITEQQLCCNDCYTRPVCYGCGRTIDEDDDARRINGELYCDDCYTYCHYHDEYEPVNTSDTAYIHAYGRICNNALDEMLEQNRIIYCRYHNRYEHCNEDETYEVQNLGIVCADAYQWAFCAKYDPCNACGQYFRQSSEQDFSLCPACAQKTEIEGDTQIRD